MPDGAATDTLCFTGGAQNANYQADENHFLTPLPVTTFTDPSAPDSVCGNLSFNGRMRGFQSTYTTNPSNEDENPWKYWWMRSRLANTGAGDRYQIDKDSVEGGDEASVSFDSLWLGSDYDAIGVILVLNSSGSLTISDLPFTELGWHGVGDLNILFQHWASKEAPVLTSVTRNGLAFTLAWSNRHAERSIDSTNVYRNGTHIRTVGPSVESHVDSNLAPGIYRYSLKHISWPTVVSAGASQRPPFPNSSSSNSIWDTIPAPPPPPDPLAMYVAGTDLIMEDDWYTWTMVTSDGTPPYAPHLWEYQRFGTSTWTQVGSDSTYTRYVETTDDWFWLRAAVWDDGDPTDSVVNRRLAVETWDGGGGGAAPGLLASRVGVRLNDGTCSPRPPAGDPGRQAWLQMVMETVRRIQYCTVEARLP